MSSVISLKSESSHSGEIELGKLIGQLLDHRKLIIILTAIFAVLAVVYALFATPIYQADALIQVEQNKAMPSLIASVRCCQTVSLIPRRKSHFYSPE